MNRYTVGILRNAGYGDKIEVVTSRFGRSYIQIGEFKSRRMWRSALLKELDWLQSLAPNRREFPTIRAHVQYYDNRHIIMDVFDAGHGSNYELEVNGKVYEEREPKHFIYYDGDQFNVAPYFQKQTYFTEIVNTDRTYFKTFGRQSFTINEVAVDHRKIGK
jgi:hypothetical protein